MVWNTLSYSNIFVFKCNHYLDKPPHKHRLCVIVSFDFDNECLVEQESRCVFILIVFIQEQHNIIPEIDTVWYLIENKEADKDDRITIEGIWKKKTYVSTVRPEVRRCIPLYYTSVVQSIVNKTIDDNTKVLFDVKTSSDLHKYTKKALLSAVEDDQHSHRLIHTPNQTVLSSRPHKFQEGYKVFLSTTSYYQAFVDNCGMTQSIAFIRCTSQEEANRICKVLSHPLYKFVNDICRYGNFNNIRVMQRFPCCCDYEAVYGAFGITDEEIAVIEGK